MPVLFEEYELVPRLIQLRQPREILWDILENAAGQRANVTPSDPSGTYGIEMRRWCTRFLRDDPRLQELGWVACSHNQIDGIRNDDLEMKVAFMNTDAATGMPSKVPHSVAEKGAFSEQLIKHNYDVAQGTLFAVPETADPISHYDFWYLCAHVGENHIAAELSRPVGLKNSIVNDYSERLILWQPGQQSGTRPHGPVPEDFAKIERPSLVPRG